jgi:hypothetical protein
MIQVVQADETVIYKWNENYQVWSGTHAISTNK